MKIIATSRLRYLDLDGDFETKSRFLDCQDKLFESVKIFSIETTSRQIQDPQGYFFLRFYLTFFGVESGSGHYKFTKLCSVL